MKPRAERSRQFGIRGELACWRGGAERHRHPAGSVAGRRSVRVRSLEGPAGADRRDRRRRAATDGDLAPPATRQAARRADPGRPDRAVRAAGRLGDRARQRRHHRVLGRRHVRADRPAQRAPRVRRVLVEVRRRVDRRAAPQGTGGRRERTRRSSRTDRRRRGRPVRVHSQRDVDRRGDDAPTPAGNRRRPRRRRRARRPPAGWRGTRTTSTSTTSPPRSASRPTAGSGSRRAPPLRSSGSNASRRATGGDRRRSISASRSPTAAPTRPTTRRPSPRLILVDDQIRWMLDNGGLDWCVERSRTSAATLYSWAEAREWATPVRRRSGQAIGRGGHHRPRPVDRRQRRQRRAASQRHRRHRQLPQARSQPTAHRHVPGHRTGRRRGAHGVRRPRRRRRSGR